jgi:hypothetical protein
MRIEFSILNNIYKPLLLEEKTEETPDTRTFELYCDLPAEVQKHIASHVTDTKTRGRLLSTCKQLYYHLPMWPEAHLHSLLSHRYRCDPACKEDAYKLVERVCLAIQRKEIGFSLPIVTCGTYMDTLPPELPVEELVFHHPLHHRATLLPKDLQKLKDLPLVKGLILSCRGLNDFVFDEEPPQIPSITSLHISGTDLSTKGALSLIGCFPNLTKLRIDADHELDSERFIYQIEPRPLITNFLIPVHTLKPKDFLQLFQVFPNMQMHTIPLAHCAEINHIDISHMKVFHEVRVLDVSFSPITVDTLYKFLEKLPNVEKLRLNGCTNLDFAALREKESFPSVKEIDLLIPLTEEEKDMLKRVFPNATLNEPIIFAPFGFDVAVA